MDNISFMDILKVFDKQVKNINPDKIESIRDKYQEELELYNYVEHSEIQTMLSKGNSIRYVKKDNTLSCVSIVRDIIYTKSKKFIDCIILSAPYRDNIWKIYPTNHYIFIRDENRLNKKIVKIVKEKLTESGKVFMNVEVSKKALKKFSEDIKAIDKNLDKIFKKTPDNQKH